MTLLVCLMLFSIVSCYPIQLDANATEYHQRADVALQSFLLNFWDQGSYYILTNINSSYVTQYRNFAHGFDAILDAIDRTNAEQYYGWANTFYNSQAKIGWFTNRYDDENWMALALVRAHDLALAQQDATSATNFINTAADLLNDIAHGWDVTCCGNLKGGIWWDKNRTQKATTSNAGPVILAVQIYERTPNEQYLNWAEEWFSFWSSNMVSSAYEIADHFDSRGQIVWSKYVYNNGLMVGAATELFKATNNEKYLAMAHNYANFMVTNMTVNSNYGPVLTDGSSSECQGACQESKGPGYRYLMNLYQADPTNSGYIYNVLQASANAIWEIGRDVSQNLFSVNWVEGLFSRHNVSDAQQNVACQALSLWAGNYGLYPGTGFPPGHYEAENAQFNLVGVEAKYTGFTGWGYAAGWGYSDGQSISFYIFISNTSCTITFRYATGVNAARVISMDDAVLFSSFTFPGTGGYNRYSTVTTSQLTSFVGHHTLTLIYSVTQGSNGYVNLDSVTLNM